METESHRANEGGEHCMISFVRDLVAWHYHHHHHHYHQLEEETSLYNDNDASSLSSLSSFSELQQHTTNSIWNRIQQQHSFDCGVTTYKEDGTTTSITTQNTFPPALHMASETKHDQYTTYTSSFQDNNTVWQEIYTTPQLYDTNVDHLFQQQQLHPPRILLALQSTVPVLNTTAVAQIRQAATTYWKTVQQHSSSDNTTTQSRFTLQRIGNSEVHVTDLPLPMQNLVNDVLTTHVYPVMRHYYLNDENDNNNKYKLCVYDALVIRYNATEAATTETNVTDTTGAGQPWHRDLGLATLNIRLSEVHEFVGGGTLFEDQLVMSTTVPVPPKDSSGGTTFTATSTTTSTTTPLQPSQPGYGIIHGAAQRHAGVATQQGIRDILVVFVTTTPQPCPAVQTALLKSCRDYCISTTTSNTASLICRLQHLQLAIQVQPTDGEVWQYLAVALLEYYDSLLLLRPTTTHPDETTVTQNDDSDRMVSNVLKHALDAIEQAVYYTPCDWRVYQVQARILDRCCRVNTNNIMNDGKTVVDHKDNKRRKITSQDVETAYQYSLQLWKAGQQAHVTTTLQEEQGLRLNYALHLANRDLWERSCTILQPMMIRTKKEEKEHDHRTVINQVESDIHRLYEYCWHQMQQDK
jgi:hypothetical protein